MPINAEITPLKWSGYNWNVADNETVGSSHYSANNVQVDENGDLHLKISKDKSGNWSCAQIVSQKSFGFGKYQFWVIGRLDKLDKNVALGLFNFGGPNNTRKKTNETDIEISRWGNPNCRIVEYSVKPKINCNATPEIPIAWGWNSTEVSNWDRLEAKCPCPIGCYKNQPGSPNCQWYCDFDLNLSGNDTTSYTTHRFLWQNNSIFFESLYGHRDWIDSKNDNNSVINCGITPNFYSMYIPQEKMPVVINLWLCLNQTKPSSNRSIEVVIRKFAYSPL